MYKPVVAAAVVVTPSVDSPLSNTTPLVTCAKPKSPIVECIVSASVALLVDAASGTVTLSATPSVVDPPVLRNRLIDVMENIHASAIFRNPYRSKLLHTCM